MIKLITLLTIWFTGCYIAGYTLSKPYELDITPEEAKQLDRFFEREERYTKCTIKHTDLLMIEGCVGSDF